MSEGHRLTSSDLGILRIYLRPQDRAPGSKRSFFRYARPLYRELVALAKEAGIGNAVVHQTHYGFGNPHLTACVELVGRRAELETFCRKNGELLLGKAIVFSSVEQWSVGGGNEPFP